MKHCYHTQIKKEKQGRITEVNAPKRKNTVIQVTMAPAPNAEPFPYKVSPPSTRKHYRENGTSEAKR